MPSNAQPPLPPLAHCGLTFTQKLFRISMLILPVFLHRSIYDLLASRKGSRIFPSHDIFHLPFGLILKIFRASAAASESAALAILDDLEVCINHPVLFDCIPARDTSRTYLISTYISGDGLCDIWDDLTLSDKQRLTEDMHEQIYTLRSVTTRAPGHLICSPNGGPIIDNRVPWLAYEPDAPLTFNQHAEFASQVWLGLDHDVPYRRALRPVLLPFVERNDVAITFCHGDIYPRNIILPGGLDAWRRGDSRICLIDWDQAGWMPMYWDAFKATFMEWEKDTEWFEMMWSVFADCVDWLEVDWEWCSRSNIPIL